LPFSLIVSLSSFDEHSHYCHSVDSTLVDV
jgi:hypothetical protein